MGKKTKSALLRERNKSRKEEGGYVRITHFVVRSPQFRSLSSRAVTVFIHLLARYNGKNNGDLSIARSELPSLGFGKNGIAFAGAIDELVSKGFVIITRPGKYGTGATLYAVTTEPMDASTKHDFNDEHAASNAWRKLPCTAAVQSSALRQCNARRRVTSNCTEPVRVDSAPAA